MFIRHSALQIQNTELQESGKPCYSLESGDQRPLASVNARVLLESWPNVQTSGPVMKFNFQFEMKFNPANPRNHVNNNHDNLHPLI